MTSAKDAGDEHPALPPPQVISRTTRRDITPAPYALPPPGLVCLCAGTSRVRDLTILSSVERCALTTRAALAARHAIDLQRTRTRTAGNILRCLWDHSRVCAFLRVDITSPTTLRAIKRCVAHIARRVCTRAIAVPRWHPRAQRRAARAHTYACERVPASAHGRATTRRWRGRGCTACLTAPLTNTI